MQMTPPEWLTVGARRLPVYWLNDIRHLGVVARELASGRSSAFYSGVFHVLGRASHELAREAGGRGGKSATLRAYPRIPVFLASPRAAIPLIDVSLVHPAFRLPERLVELYASVSAPLEVVAPLGQAAVPSHGPCGSATTPYQEVGANHMPIDIAGAAPHAAFLWMHDIAWTLLAELLAAGGARGALYRVLPLSDARNRPFYSLHALADWASMREQVPFDFVAHDARMESAGAFSDHTRIRLPLLDEAPALHVVRSGSVSAAWLAEASGWPVESAVGLQRGDRAAGLSDDDLRLRLGDGWQG